MHFIFSPAISWSTSFCTSKLMSILLVIIARDFEAARRNHYFIRSTLSSSRLPMLFTKYSFLIYRSFEEYALSKNGNATLQNIFFNLLLTGFMFFFLGYSVGSGLF